MTAYKVYGVLTQQEVSLVKLAKLVDGYAERVNRHQGARWAAIPCWNRCAAPRQAGGPAGRILHGAEHGGRTCWRWKAIPALKPGR